MSILELLENSAKLSELSAAKSLAQEAPTSGEAKKWHELSLVTMQFCADGLAEQQRRLVKTVTGLSSKGASFSRHGTPALAGSDVVQPSLTSIVASLPRPPTAAAAAVQPNVAERPSAMASQASSKASKAKVQPQLPTKPPNKQQTKAKGIVVPVTAGVKAPP